jgi:hypothetical protein
MPQLGQASPGAAGPPGALGVLTGPVPAWGGALCVPLLGLGITGAAPVWVNTAGSMRKPHTSQKSSLAD